MLDEKALKALDKLERLAKEELAKIEVTSSIYHDLKFRKLSEVPNWVRFVRESHTNPYCKSAVEGCLENLRNVAREFKFNLN